MDFYERRASKRRKVLELAISEVKFYDGKREMREVFEVLHNRGWEVTAYRQRLESALEYIDKAVKAIEALES